MTLFMHAQRFCLFIPFLCFGAATVAPSSSPDPLAVRQPDARRRHSPYRSNLGTFCALASFISASAGLHPHPSRSRGAEACASRDGVRDNALNHSGGHAENVRAIALLVLCLTLMPPTSCQIYHHFVSLTSSSPPFIFVLGIRPYTHARAHAHSPIPSRPQTHCPVSSSGVN